MAFGNNLVWRKLFNPTPSGNLKPGRTGAYPYIDKSLKSNWTTTWLSILVTKIVFSVPVNFFIFEERLFRKPSIITMLCQRQVSQSRKAFYFISEHNVVSPKARLVGKIALVKMLVHAHETRRFDRERNAQLVYRNPPESGAYPFIFPDSASGDEPSILRGTVFSKTPHTLFFLIYFSSTNTT